MPMEGKHAEAEAGFTIDWSKLLFGFSLLGLMFGYGVLVGVYNIFPYSIIKHGFDSTKVFIEEFDAITGTKPVGHIFPSRHNRGKGLVINNSKLMAPGLTVITGFFEDGLEIRLIAEDGSVVNKWPVSVLNIWDNFNHLPESARPQTDWNAAFNGIVLQPDGSVIFPMKGLVKMDRCGVVEWKVPHWIHHSVEHSPRGTYWVPGRSNVTDKSKHSPIEPPYEVDSIVEVSADGKILREIAILDIMWKNDMLAELFANNRNFDPNPELDVVHLNDVEEIPIQYLSRFPQFSAGDLLLTLRQGNMLMVVAPDSLDVKWYKVGPWIQPHDADWQPDGTITVFDNGFDGSKDGKYFGGSNIISIHPITREIQYLYGDQADHNLFTGTQGDQQVLSNSNILITEANQGRILEVTPTGEIVWEYINRYSDKEVVRVSDATRYPYDYFSVKDWSCD